LCKSEATGTATFRRVRSWQLKHPTRGNASERDGSNNWPGTGSGNVQVVGFSWWIIKDYASGGKIVDAVYVGPAPTDPTNTTLPPAHIPELTGSRAGRSD
jgi:hypothetical protein